MIMLDEALTKAVVTKKDGYVEFMRWNILFERYTIITIAHNCVFLQFLSMIISKSS